MVARCLARIAPTAAPVLSSGCRFRRSTKYKSRKKRHFSAKKPRHIPQMGDGTLHECSVKCPQLLSQCSSVGVQSVIDGRSDLQRIQRGSFGNFFTTTFGWFFLYKTSL